MVVQIVSIDKLGEVIREIRSKVKGLTQDQVQKLTGYSKAHIIALEKGNANFTTDALERMAEALGIHINIAISLEENDMKRLIEAKS